MEKIIIESKDAPSPIGPYSQATMAGGFLYMSGQIAIDPATGALELSSVEKETLRVMQNLEAVLLQAGYTFDQVLKTTIFLNDMALFAEVNEVYGRFFSGSFPARETVAVKGLPKGVNVEISMIAFK